MGRQEKEGKKKKRGKIPEDKKIFESDHWILELERNFFIWNDLKLIKFWKKLIPVFFIHFFNSYINIIFIYLRTYGLNKF